MPREELTSKEKATLYGMARHPAFNDRQLSEALKEKMSTVTSIRRRLNERRIYFKAMVPSFEGLGCEVLMICHGGVSSGYLVDMKKALDRGFFSGEDDPSFFAQVGTFSWIELGAFRNYSEAQRKGEGLWRRLNDLLGGIQGHPCIPSYYPIGQVELHAYFDFTLLLGKLFGISGKGERPPPAPKRSARKLSEIERLVFYGLVKHPDVADKLIANKLSISRQAVARIRKLLVKERFLFPLIVPSLDKLGFEIMAYLRFHLNPRKSDRARQGTVAGILHGIPHFFALSTSLECVLMGAFRTFWEFEKRTTQVIRRMEEGGFLEGPPEVQTFLLTETVIVKNHDYVPVVKSMLELRLED